MLNDMELQARIEHFLHRKEEQFPELAPKSNARRRPDSTTHTFSQL